MDGGRDRDRDGGERGGLQGDLTGRIDEFREDGDIEERRLGIEGIDQEAAQEIAAPALCGLGFVLSPPPISIPTFEIKAY